MKYKAILFGVGVFIATVSFTISERAIAGPEDCCFIYCETDPTYWQCKGHFIIHTTICVSEPSPGCPHECRTCPPI